MSQNSLAIAYAIKKRNGMRNPKLEESKKMAEGGEVHEQSEQDASEGVSTDLDLDEEMEAFDEENAPKLDSEDEIDPELLKAKFLSRILGSISKAKFAK